MSLSPEAVIARQLEAYNARNIDALLATYADDAQMFDFPATLLAAGAASLRERFLVRFQEPNLRATLLNRVVMGSIVMDYEEVTRTFPEGAGKVELMMIYEVNHGKIAKAWIIAGEKTLDAARDCTGAAHIRCGAFGTVHRLSFCDGIPLQFRASVHSRDKIGSLYRPGCIA
jgi:hypothetical protein